MASPSRVPAGARRPGPKKKGAPTQPLAAKGRKKKARPKKSGLDLYHLLAVAAGAFSGLALYAVITPGQLPNEQAEVRLDPRNDLKLAQLKGGRGADGFMHVRGQLMNGRAQTCRLASVTIRFFDKAGQPVADTMATVNGIAGRSAGAFEARAHAPGAVRFEVAVDLAQFDSAHGRP